MKPKTIRSKSFFSNISSFIRVSKVPWLLFFKGPITRPQLTRAVLNYKGVNRFRRPVSVPRLCTQQNPCYVVNQIYG